MIYLKKIQEQKVHRHIFRYFALKFLSQIPVTVRGTASGVIKVYSNENGTLIGTIPVEQSAEWTIFKTVSTVADGTMHWILYTKAKVLPKF